MEKKICSKCKEEKEVCDFVKRKDSKDGFRSECKSCGKKSRLNNKTHLLEYSKKWRASNTEHISNYNKNYNKKNMEMVKKYQKEWYVKNKDKINKKIKLRKETDSIYLISCNVRKRMSEYIKKNNILKSNKTFDIVGLTPKELSNHLELNFNEGMSWDNYGVYGWHIDHIIPLSSAKNEDELYKLCHYTNLQPLWWFDNLSKGNKIL